MHVNVYAWYKFSNARHQAHQSWSALRKRVAGKSCGMIDKFDMEYDINSASLSYFIA